MKGAVFDMDGLMLDTERVAVLAFDYAGEKAGIGRAGYMTERLLGLSLESSRPVWRAEFGEGCDPYVIDAFAREFRTEYYKTHKIPVKPGIFEILAFFHGEGVKLAVASSTRRKTVERQLSDTGLISYFDALVCGDEVERSKPDPEIYVRACEKLGFLPAECYAFEDARSGIISADSAGCRVIMVPDLWLPDGEIFGRVHAVCRDLCSAAELIMHERAAGN